MTPDPDTPIWHYLDLAKYVGLLARGLFFCIPSALRASDPWEGSRGEIDARESLDATVHARQNGVAEWKEDLLNRHIKQDGFGLSCWHESPTESAALWQLYAPFGLGVVVRSTPRKVQAALGERSIEVRCIDYGGHLGRRLSDDPTALLTTKRPEFTHEAEVRFLVALTSDEKTVLTSFYNGIERHGTFRYVRPGSKGPHVVPGRAFAVDDPTCLHRGAPAGVHLPTDIATLVECVHLAPSYAYSLRRAVIDVTKQFGLSKKVVKEAALDLAPFDSIEFDEGSA